MSLDLLQGYSSAEEDEEEDEEDDGQLALERISSDEDGEDTVPKSRCYKPLSESNPQSSSSLPSAFVAFSEISGPPQFLNNSVQEELPKVDGRRWRHGGQRSRRDKKELPSGAVLESKAQLVGIRERVRSDIENNSATHGQSSSSTGIAGRKPLATVSNPSAEEAAELLRMCVRCGIPKTYSHTKGMVCPMCGDRPPPDTSNEQVKKKGSTIKDKEKSKRMKGQSSHSAWKSETEMQLRQQFD